MAGDQELRSPRLQTLLQELAAGNPDALASFWRDIAEQGTPLIEPISDDDAHASVTFLWRDTAETGAPVVLSPVMEPTSRTLFVQRMSRLPGTDVWYAIGRARTDLRATYHLSTGNAFRDFEAVVTDPAALENALGESHIDPLNKQPFRVDDPFLPPQSTLTLPAAVPQPWIVTQPAVPPGTVRHHQVPGTLLAGAHDVWVYLPPGYSAQGAPYPLLLLFDGWAYLHWIPTPTILDNLTAAARLPPTVAVLVNNGDAQARSRDLTCSPAYADFVAHDLVPWVRRAYHVTADPRHTIAGGSSFGGLAAAFLGLRHPDVFGRILCQSGSFWWAPAADGEAEWLTRQFADHPLLPLRVYLDAGLQEMWGRSADRPNLLIATRHFRDVLRAKGYAVQYAEFNGGHDYICWRGTLADGLIALSGT